MKHFKGRISIFLALVLMCSTAIWAETQPSPSMTFRSEDKVSWLVSAESLVEKDETIRYEDAAMSVKWTPNVGKVAAIRIQNLAEKGMVTDWTDYNMLKLRIYSDVATGKHAACPAYLYGGHLGRNLLGAACHNGGLDGLEGDFHSFQ